MALIVPFIKQLHRVAGYRIYMNFIGMMLISSLEGVAIYLLVPMMSLIGIFNMSTASIPFLSSVTGALHQLPEPLRLPVILGTYVLLVIGQALIQKNQTLINNRIQQKFIKTLRVETYESLLQSNWSLFLGKRKSDLKHIMTTDLANVAQGTSLTLRLATSLIFTCIQIAFSLWLSVKLTLFVLVSGLLIAVFFRKSIRRAKKLGVQSTELSQSYMGGLTDHLNGIKDIKSNQLEDYHVSWFRSLSNQMEAHYLKFVNLQSNSQLFYKIASAILIGVFVFVSFELLQAQTAQLMLIIIIFSRLWPKFSGIQSSWEQIVSLVPAFKNLTQLQTECANAKEEVEEHIPTNQENSIRIQHGMECRDLYYRYDRTQAIYALQDIHLHIPVNSMTAIVGKSGAGKSTLIDILIGLIHPEQGELRIDGNLMTKANMNALRSSVSYVSQDPALFHASLRENLLLVNPNATEEQIWEALRFSASEEFVRRLPQGLDTIIGDRGVRLSGGERQRIVMARAILRKPAILVLDEATSALDNENEAKIQAALERLKGSMTIIVIAHRLSTIRNADQVIVLDKGRIIQQGSYQQLSRETRGTFSKLLRYQTEINASSWD